MTFVRATSGAGVTAVITLDIQIPVSRREKKVYYAEIKSKE